MKGRAQQQQKTSEVVVVLFFFKELSEIKDIFFFLISAPPTRPSAGRHSMSSGERAASAEPILLFQQLDTALIKVTFLSTIQQVHLAKNQITKSLALSLITAFTNRTIQFQNMNPTDLPALSSLQKKIRWNMHRKYNMTAFKKILSNTGCKPSSVRSGWLS